MKNSSVFLLLIALFVSAATLAQPGGGPESKKQKIEELKIAFITTELNLTSEEAQKFWPVYNEMSDKFRTEKKKQRNLENEMRDNKDIFGEAEFKKKSLEFMDSEIREAQLKKDYHIKIAEIIGYKKATNLLSLEQRFKRELLNRLNQGAPNDGNRRPGGPRSDN